MSRECFTGSRYVRRQFTKVYCRSCGRPLHECIIGTEVMCPKCNTWTIAGKDYSAKESVAV